MVLLSKLSHDLIILEAFYLEDGNNYCNFATTNNY